MTSIFLDAPVIKDILDDTMTHGRGLDYAAYAVTSARPLGDSEAKEAPLLSILYRAHGRWLASRLVKFGCQAHTADRQVALWDTALHKVNHALHGLDREFIQTGHGENVRVVFDVDMGGFFFTRLGTHAVLFGVTLDQAEVNNGRCEREMYQMVAQVEAVCTAHGA